MRVIVCGSRTWTDWLMIADRLGRLPAGSTVVHGGAKGADLIAARCAERLHLEVEPHPARWDKYGKRAGHIRNSEMGALGADLVIAFWDGHSKGTQNMLDNAAFYGIPYEVIQEDIPGKIGT